MQTRNVFLCLFLVVYCSVNAQKKQAEGGVQAFPLDKVWSGHPVGFDLVTAGDYQYACYYDAERRMTVARRSLQSDVWEKTKLPSVVGWDSHNSVKIALDKEGFIHVSGNMHVVPLVYFRSVRAWDIGEFEKLPMTGQNEERVTYPVFFKDQQEDLYFQYRNGGSGDGITYWNKYDVATGKWKNLFDKPIFDGEKESNAYMSNPVLGPDGYFYIVWMWRLTPVANTNHNLSCIRSRDFLQWENLRGEAIRLPARWSDDLAIVDPVGPWNGLINMGFQISWDTEKTPYITYHKYDANGVSQVFIARWEGQGTSERRWKIYQVSKWSDFKWDLNKRGSLANSVGISGVRPYGVRPNGVRPSGKSDLAVNYHHERYGRGTWILDRQTLRIKSTLPGSETSDVPVLPEIAIKEGMAPRYKTDNTGKYIMRWQSFPANQDRPRPGPLPDPVELVVYRISE